MWYLVLVLVPVSTPASDCTPVSAVRSDDLPTEGKPVSFVLMYCLLCC